MPLEKTIIVLAKSIKHHGYCIAGKAIDSKEWMRLVSNENGDALSNEQSKCTNTTWQSQGKNPYSTQVLHKICIKLLKHAPLNNQPENFVVSNEIWQQKFKIESSEILNYLDNPESLWGDGEKIEYSQIENNTIIIGQSLYLVKIEDGKLYKNEDKRRVSFLYKEKYYDLPVTDPNFDNILDDNNQNLVGVLCVSLGENFNGHCYKIVATIF